MKRAFILLAAFMPGLAAPAFAAEPAQRPNVTDIRKRAALDCTFRLTNDYVQNIIMMQDTTWSPEACRASCARFAQEAIVSMRDAVYVLRYTCHYREGLVADVDLKQG
ncbi:hypothetical protein [Croceicoccus naphthovorans]|uniref:Uncharacterized protein n=1 Tax=Croceicoccus naphthovorans TaxID=1348774 RepID=A0A0G3XEL3_9SPHN|nr:hypothetical protein [Croceicoccus naphthovorans]AKM09627.1 hypothetical protein AB433_05950 [Croceicoccus naphthovorans]MBB3989595.1 hypothetical protein [Croceicoccus naphthovorans]